MISIRYSTKTQTETQDKLADFFVTHEGMSEANSPHNMGHNNRERLILELF